MHLMQLLLLFLGFLPFIPIELTVCLLLLLSSKCVFLAYVYMCKCFVCHRFELHWTARKRSGTKEIEKCICTNDNFFFSRRFLQNLHEIGFVSYLTVNYYSRLSLVLSLFLLFYLIYLFECNILKKKAIFCVFRLYNDIFSGFNSSIRLFLRIFLYICGFHSFRPFFIYRFFFWNCPLNKMLWFFFSRNSCKAPIWKQMLRHFSYM